MSSLPFLSPKLRRAFRNHLAYPAGVAPGFDPTHPAGKISAGMGFSGVASNGGFVSLLNGAIGSPSGSITRKILGGIGEASLFTSGGGTGFSGQSTTTPPGVTFGGIIQIDTAADCGFICTRASTNGAARFGLSTSNVLQFTYGAVIAIDSGITLSNNTPYFVAASHKSGTGPVYFVVTDLNTGRITTATVSNSSTSTALDGTICVGAAWTSNGPFKGSVAAVSYAPYNISAAELLAWAQAPWAFWYPDQVSPALVGTASTTSVGAGAATALATGVGSSIARSVGSGAATASASGVGKATTNAVGSASATATASGVGKATTNAVGAASATASASGVGQATTNAVGSASATATATGISLGGSVGAASATATTTGVGAATTNAVGAAAAAGSAAAVGVALGIGVGSGSASSSAAGAGAATTNAVGASSATATANGVGSSNASSGDGSAAATSSATGVAASTVAAVGSASATSAATGFSPVLVVDNPTVSGGGGGKWRSETSTRSRGRGSVKITTAVTEEELRDAYERAMGLKGPDKPLPKNAQKKVYRAVNVHAITEALKGPPAPDQVDWTAVLQDKKAVETLLAAAARLQADDEDAIIALLLAS